MRLSNKQKMLLHIVPEALGVTEAERRVIQRNVGGFFSAADATCTREGFIAVMAFYESKSPSGFLPGFDAGYWASAAETAGPNDPLIRRVRQEAFKLRWGDRELNLFLAGKHMSSGRYRAVDDAPPYWLSRLLEALKAMNKRQAISPQRAQR